MSSSRTLLFNGYLKPMWTLDRFLLINDWVVSKRMALRRPSVHPAFAIGMRHHNLWWLSEWRLGSPPKMQFLKKINQRPVLFVSHKKSDVISDPNFWLTYLIFFMFFCGAKYFFLFYDFSSLFTTTVMDHQILRKKVHKRISVRKANTLYVSKELAF